LWTIIFHSHDQKSFANHEQIKYVSSNARRQPDDDGVDDGNKGVAGPPIPVLRRKEA